MISVNMSRLGKDAAGLSCAQGSVLRTDTPAAVIDLASLRATAVEQALVGRSAADLGDVCAQVADGTNPPSDLNGDADYRRHLARVLTRRAVLTALGG